jgi:sugar lactone lactonase YvrE
MRSQRTAERPLVRWVAASALFVGLLAGVTGSTPSGAQTQAGPWTITAFAGTGAAGFSGDGGPATSANMTRPYSVAANDQGDVYVVDAGNYRIRKVGASGTVTTVVGTGVRGFSGDGGPATSARIWPCGVAVDGAGNLFIADCGNNRIRKVNADGIITTVAGTGARGFSGDGGPATSARLAAPPAIALDGNGNLFIVDQLNHRIRKVDADGIITTVAGTGARGFSGDGGLATAAQLQSPQSVALDPSGNLYIADTTNDRVRKVDNEGIITTFAGDGSRGYGGDGGPATSAQLHFPTGVVVQGSGNVFISDTANHAIRRVDASGRIETVAGRPPFSDSYGDGGSAPYAALRQPAGIGLDAAGNLYIADVGNHRVRRVETSYLWISSGAAPSRVGESFTYTLNVSGLPTTATGVKVTAALAPEVAFAGATASQGSCGNNAGTVTCELGTVEPGATAVMGITVNARGAGLIPISGTVSSDPEVIPGNRTATAYTKVSAANCGQTITADTVLSEDIGPCAGNGVLFGSDGITFDLGGKRIFGFDNPGDGHEAGIRVKDRTGITVKNGTVTGFDAGVVVERGGSNTVTGMTIRDNIGPDDPRTELGDGIAIIESAGNFVHDNLVVNNGIYDGIGVLGVGSDNNTVERNTIEDTVGPARRGIPFGQGIIVNAASFGEFTSEVVSGTKINHNVIRNSASAGIANINNFDGEIVRNTVENNGHRQTFGNGIGVQVGLGLPDDNSNLLIQGNEVHGNALDGIQIPTNFMGEGADENRILNNNAANNGRRDLFDGHPDCANNVWRNNTWGTGGYSPDCVTLGGKGPKVKAKDNPAQSAIDARELQRGQRAPSVDELETP